MRSTMLWLTTCVATWCLIAGAEPTPDVIENSIGVRMKLLPAGTFTMGDDTGDAFERPAHRVTLSRPFYMGVYEVTHAQWKQVMNSSPSNPQAADHPVENVDWQEAIAFCEKLSALPEERKQGRVCRAGTTTKFSFGDHAANLGEYGWFEKNSPIATQSIATHQVGLKKPNAWGLYDMHGNVREWCNDRPDRYRGDAVTDPSELAEQNLRILRGGSWRDPAGYAKSSYRISTGTWVKGGEIGFRLALSLSGTGPAAAEK
jgi:formylglycine-generating enzyme required for sulfatase activity